MRNVNEAARTTGGKPSSRRRSGATNKAQRRSSHSVRLLVVVDASEASKRVLQYVGRILRACDRGNVHLAYIASHVPPELLESGGAEAPEREEQVEADLRSAQSQWMDVNDTQPERSLRSARAALQRAGVTAARIHSCVSSPLDGRTTATEVLLLARDQQCRTIVVGHRAHTWFSGLGGGHLAEQLVRSADGVAIWVVD